MSVRIFTWNVNGIRAITNKEVHNGSTFWEYIVSTQSDIVCLNETKIDADNIQAIKVPDVYPYVYHSHADKKGYSGVSVYSKCQPLRKLRIPNMLNVEGRLIALEFKKVILVALYQPNSGAILKRAPYRKKWDYRFRKYIASIEHRKSVIIVGDMNVANDDIDIFAPETHRRCAGFTNVERDNFKLLLNECRLSDEWRRLHPRTSEYTYFDYRSGARKRNHGWRLDYILVSKRLSKRVKSCTILNDVTGSDHVPMSIECRI